MPTRPHRPLPASALAGSLTYEGIDNAEARRGTISQYRYLGLLEKKGHMRTQHNETRCKARTKSGRACRAAAMEGGLCFFHANPNKASELGRIGGRRNRHVSAENADPLPSLDNALAVQNTLARLANDVYSGKLQPRVALSLAHLLSLLLRAIGITDIEQRLAKLERERLPLEGDRTARPGPENQIPDVSQAPMTSPKSEIGSAEGNRSHGDGSGVGDAQSD
jgi:hypothetical protein